MVASKVGRKEGKKRKNILCRQGRASSHVGMSWKNISPLHFQCFSCLLSWLTLNIYTIFAPKCCHVCSGWHMTFLYDYWFSGAQKYKTMSALGEPFKKICVRNISWKILIQKKMFVDCLFPPIFLFVLRKTAYLLTSFSTLPRNLTVGKSKNWLRVNVYKWSLFEIFFDGAGTYLLREHSFTYLRNWIDFPLTERLGIKLRNN